MIVTTTLLSTVMYVVWGFIFIIPLAFLLFFGLIDGVFWACTTSPSFKANQSNTQEIHDRCLVPIYGRHYHDRLYGLLEMGNVQETLL